MGSPAEHCVTSVVSAVWEDADVCDSVFSRWHQGFIFSPDDPLVLLQHEGGPCAVIAPVQAHIFKHMLLIAEERWRQLTSAEVLQLLCRALVEILERSAHPDVTARLVVQQSPPHPSPSSSQPPNSMTSQQSEQLSYKRSRLSPEGFHSSLQIVEVPCGQELHEYINTNISQFRNASGVLLFLYSAIASRGVDRVCSELGGSEQTLVDRVHGHGSQALTNLLITGRAVAHVWDNTKHVGGMALEGILTQPQIGFLTVMERLHYCTVGWNLKNPLHPVWLLASETHLTVLFSPCRRLARPPSARQLAGRSFDRLDLEGAGFVPAAQLSQLLASCQLVHEPEYVQLMEQALDPERLGVILRPAFLDEFFPERQAARSTADTVVGGHTVDADERPPDSFTVFHCNSLPRSSNNQRVQLRRGEACILECDVDCTSATDSLLTCLQSKWPRIDVRWEGPIPSVN